MPLLASLDILSDYGRLKGSELGQYSLQNALALARGPLPITVLLQEPCNLADTEPFETVVYGDPSAEKGSVKHRGSLTLQDIDYYTECASNVDHDLRDICVLDLNALLSPGVQSRSTDCKRDSHRQSAQLTTWRMSKAETPKILLVLTTKAGDSKIPGLRRLGCSLRSAGSMEKFNIRGREFLVIYGFHPSVYLRKDYVSKRGWSQADALLARNVLHFCFDQAFAYLEGQEVVPMHGEMLKRWEELTERKQISKQTSKADLLKEALERLSI